MTDTVAGIFNPTTYRWQRELRNRAGVRVVVPATAEPVTLAQAAEHLRIDAYGSPATYPEEMLIEALITAAREYVEHASGLTLAPQTIEITGRSFSGLCRYEGDDAIELRTAPVRGIDSVTYVDTAGATQTLSSDSYLLDDTSDLPTLHLAYGASGWPSARDQAAAVRIRFTAGYDAEGGSPTVAVLPMALRAAILLMVGHLYENREQTAAGQEVREIPLGITALIERWKLRIALA